MQIIFNLYLGVLITSMIVLMIGVPSPTLGYKRSEILNRRMGWANAALIFTAALFLAATR